MAGKRKPKNGDKVCITKPEETLVGTIERIEEKFTAPYYVKVDVESSTFLDEHKEAASQCYLNNTLAGPFTLDEIDMI
jgi:predicted SpoU family rRNA methylase